VGRAFTIRRELQAALEEIGDPSAFAAGLRAAINAGAGNVNYARKAMRPRPLTDSGPHTNGRAEYVEELLPQFSEKLFRN